MRLSYLTTCQEIGQHHDHGCTSPDLIHIADSHASRDTATSLFLRSFYSLIACIMFTHQLLVQLYVGVDHSNKNLCCELYFCQRHRRQDDGLVLPIRLGNRMTAHVSCPSLCSFSFSILTQWTSKK